MKTFKMMLYVLIPVCLSLAGCGRKITPKPPKGVEVIYPGIYPKPDCEMTPDCEIIPECESTPD